ncbi:MAG: hypothetical protein UR26_C0002G0105 [candidate division TM6 bacterium GW2011_GWF2_32_72]|nr:MAG: hypothetical protein UR26_C0002G0105 [candidate division TM6 bacterium GW2011_GWF2_32_72]
MNKLTKYLSLSLLLSVNLGLLASSNDSSDEEYDFEAEREAHQKQKQWISDVKYVTELDKQIEELLVIQEKHGLNHSQQNKLGKLLNERTKYNDTPNALEVVMQNNEWEDTIFPNRSDK